MTNNPYIDIVLMAACWVFLLDISGAWYEVTSGITRLITRGISSKPWTLKPFSCSLCMTFWSSLAYLLITRQLGIVTFSYACLAAMATPRIKDILITIDILIARVISKI